MHCKSGKAACNYISSVAGLVNKLCFTDYQRGTKPLGQIVSECKSQTIKMRVIKFQNQVRNKSYEKERNNHKTWSNETIPSLSLLTTTYDCSSFTERKALSSERVIGYIVICSTILHPSFLPKKNKLTFYLYVITSKIWSLIKTPLNSLTSAHIGTDSENVNCLLAS